VTPAPDAINLKRAITDVLEKHGFQQADFLKAGLLFHDPQSDTGVIVDIGICENASLDYIDYTQEQNELMSRYPRLLRFAVGGEDALEYFQAEVQLFLKDQGDIEIPATVRRGREETHPDPTHPEARFETLFGTGFGGSAMYALQREKPFSDLEGRVRFLDYALTTQKRLIAIELNGESFHHPRCIGQKKYRSQLFKQNSLVLSGWKVFRWSERGMQDSERFIEEMKRFFGAVEEFKRTQHYLAQRQLGVFQLLKHQEQALLKIEQGRNAGQNAFLLLLPTGTGKTEIFIEDFRRLKTSHTTLNGLILVPTRPLREQTLSRLVKRLPELTHGEGFQNPGLQSGFMVQTYQHLVRHYQEFRPEAFDYIVVDEAHHAAAPGLRAVLEHFRPGTLLGATATDQRLDAKPLEKIFGSYETDLSLEDAIKKGLLPPIRAFRVQSNVDLSEVRFNGKDYVQSDLQTKLVIPSRDEIIADVLKKYFGDGLMSTKQGVVFCVNVAHAKAVAALLNRTGISATVVNGEDREGAEQGIASYRAKEVRFLCSCNLISEGWDAPQTSILVMARPTMSKVLYVQQLGRGTRHYPHKEALYVIDVVDRYGPLNAPWSVHALFSLTSYAPWATLVGNPAVETHDEQSQLLKWLHEEERRITEINVFTFQKQYEDYLNEEQLARALFISTGTVNAWVRRGEIKPDVEVPFGAKVLRYFNPARVDEIRKAKRLKVHDETTQYDDLFEFLEERDYTFSYKIIFLLSLLTCQNNRGEAGLENLTKLYQGFYQDRARQGLTVERQTSPYNREAYLADADEITKSILANPFEKFERKRFMHHCKDLAYVAWASALWKRLQENKQELERILQQMAEDLRKYYENLGGLGNLNFLQSSYPIVAELFGKYPPSSSFPPFAEFNDQEAYRTLLPFYPLRVAAGFFKEGDAPTPSGWIDVAQLGFASRVIKGMFVTQVVGHSMEPSIEDGSYCVFRAPVEGTRQGKVVLVQKRDFLDPETGGSYTVKRYRSTKTAAAEEEWRHETIELIPDNPDRARYPVLKFTATDDAELQTVAEFVGALKIAR
jgi:superfamily II DNA or RNA helicase